MSLFLQHHLNPLHVFCRLRKVGLPKKPAISICKLYERAVFNPFLANKGNLKVPVIK